MKAKSIMEMKAKGCCRNVAKWGHGMPVQNLIHDVGCANFVAERPSGDDGGGVWDYLFPEEEQQQQQQ